MTDKVMDLAKNLHEQTLTTFKKLDSIWDEIGLDDDTRRERHQMFVNHVEDLYSEMVVEAEASKTNLLESIESIGKELCSLKRDLRMDISIDGYENDPLYVAKQKLKNKLETYQKLYDTKKTEINHFIKQQKILCHALGRKPKELTTSPLPTQEEINDLQSYLEELSDLKFKREEEFLKTKTKIINIMNELKIKPSLDFERKVVLCEDSAFKVTDENMKQLNDLHKSLETQLLETKIKISELRERISSLWERLEESPQIRSAFLEAHPGNSVTTLLELKTELQKLEERKKANIKLFVDKLRQELLGWWNKCYSSVEDRATFLHFDSDCYTEDLLTLHEIQVEKLKTHYEKYISIYHMYNKRESLWEKMLDLEQRASQPNRYKNRGGQLLNEEKERKSIASQLPKIENELLDLIKEYELQTGSPFLVYGKKIEELLRESWQEHKEDKRLKLSVKKKLREQIITPSKTQLLPSGSRITPSISTSKRKLCTPMTESSKRSRIDTTKSESKLLTRRKILSTSNKKLSHDKLLRLEKIKKRSQTQKNNDTNYESFENELETKSSCRSSLFPDRLLRSKTKELPISGTPRKALLTVNNTPHRTPIRPRLRSKSPSLLTPRLATCPNNLPIII